MENNDFFVYSFLIKIKDFFKKNKDIIIPTFIVGLIAHAYCFLNYLPTWDSIVGTQSVGVTFSSGRWLLKYAGMIFSDYSLSWINGLVSLLFIAFSAILLSDIFSIHNHIYRGLLAAVIVSFPTVTSTFTFMFTADCYMMAFFLATAAVYVCHKYTKWGFVPAMILLACSIGIYQAYISVFLVTVTILIIIDTVFLECNFGELIKRYYKYVISFVGGYILHSIILKLFLLIRGTTLSSYQGIKSVGILSPHEILNAFISNIISLLGIYGIDLYDLGNKSLKTWLYSFICIFLLFSVFIFTVITIIKKSLYKNPLKLFLIFFEFLAIFIFTFIIRYTTDQVIYSAIMEMSVCLFYILHIVFLLYVRAERKYIKALKNITLIALCVMVVYNSVVSNVNYFYMHIRYERTYATALNVVNDIRNSDFVDKKDSKVAVVGANRKTSNTVWNYASPTIRGSENADTILSSATHYYIFWNYFLGVNTDFHYASDDEIEKIRSTDEFKNMPSYPNKGYIKEIDGIIVAKISDKTPGKF